MSTPTVNTHGLIAITFLSLATLLPCKSAQTQTNLDLRKYLPQQKDVPDHDLSKIPPVKQIKNSASQSVNIHLVNNTHILVITIAYTDNNKTSESLISNIVRNNPGNLWRQGLLFSRQIGSYSAHTEVAQGKPRDSISLLVSEGKILIMVQYSRLPTNPANQSVKRTALSDSDIRRVESIISNIFTKMQRDGLTR